MNDGTCMCGGQCHCPWYPEALNFTADGVVSVFTTHADDLAFTAYLPTDRQLSVLLDHRQKIRAAGHIALANRITREVEHQRSGGD